MPKKYTETALLQGNHDWAGCAIRALSALLLQAGVGGQLRSLDVDDAVLWFNHKRMLPGSKLSDYVGRNEKTKVLSPEGARGSSSPSVNYRDVHTLSA